MTWVIPWLPWLLVATDSVIRPGADPAPAPAPIPAARRRRAPPGAVTAAALLPTEWSKNSAER
jgi:hypothetical protein